jgi:adenylate cyclase
VFILSVHRSPKVTMPMLTFRVAITGAVMAIVTALALGLILIQAATIHAAATSAAYSAMDFASANSISQLEADISKLSSLVRVLSANAALKVPGDQSEADVIDVFKVALHELQQADSFYVGYANGAWLQVRRLDVLGPNEQAKLGAPAAAVYNINLVRPMADGDLAMHRIFENAEGTRLEQRDLPNYGYDARKRGWYRDAMQAASAVVSPPYRSFSLGTPMITLSAPLAGHGVVAADLKLDNFSDHVRTARPGEHGKVIIFDEFGSLIAHPEYIRLLQAAENQSSDTQLPDVGAIRSDLVGSVMRRWNGEDTYEGDLRYTDGQTYFFRIRKFPMASEFKGYFLLIAAEEDFAEDIRNLQKSGLIIALVIGGCFVPVVWIFGSRMSTSLKLITEQAGRLRTLTMLDDAPIGSQIAEIDELGRTMSVAQRAVRSFARFIPGDIVKGIIDGSISTELGGMRREVTILFTDVSNFTGIAEAADPDSLMNQTSRHFSALTEAFHAEGGTIDKYIGDSVMVFWNAPHAQPNHVERACRAALAAKAASDRLNTQFDSEGLPRFAVRLGIHCGDAVVGNLGSAERINYTVLGNSVNLAARLEGMNKEYGTTILVSDTVQQRAEPCFVFRLVASVIAKGMTAETRVYELVEPCECEREREMAPAC